MIDNMRPLLLPETGSMVFQELLSAARWRPAKQVSEPKPRVNSGKILNTNFTKHEIAFVLLSTIRHTRKNP